ncbi:DUF222 domain-containing protein [Microlunatus speluncae]|uniref:DUF222 domain-containing protein n=1 Tax=Microlunatus speluncae TaxID=2594267 RepID=UPI0012665858|nr:DUF222 domain-containing protein [Microlunatus speluncae]
MFESLELRVAGYGTDDILKAAKAAVRARLEAENELIAWTAAWADANSADSIHPDELRLRGGPRGIRPGGDGTPEVNDLALVELAVAMRKGEFAGTRFVGEVLDVRFRLPLLWEKVMGCEVEGWQARTIARMTHHLTLEQALQVDADLAGFAGLVGFSKLRDRAEAAIARVDAERVERVAAERKSELGVWLSQTSDEGLKSLFARLEPAAAIRLYARIQELADALPADDRTPDERRAEALALLGNELEATRILAEARQPDLFAEEFAAAVQPVAGEDPDEPVEESELHQSLRDQPAMITDTGLVVFRAAVERIVAGLDPSLLLPTSTLVVHVAAESLETGSGICRVPGIGPTTMGVVKDWLGHDRVNVVPVVDLNDPPAPVDAYEIPDRHRRYLRFARPGSSFPWSTATGNLELDHTVPYRSMGEGGPPGQTGIDALAPLARREHRAVTHGGWRRRQPEPGTMIFRSPHGDTQLTNHSGTFDLGRGMFARAVWDASTPTR